ncbi:MAG: hypothetical protein KIT84_34585 [Labilithrix sp.]|nr:hypothetical protein [Labilithrix sp.]MCW5816176.1 hypothetical protein [Labilithrix sp.]
MRPVLGLVLVAIATSGCTRSPSDAEIDRALAEVRAENDAQNTKAGKAEAEQWTLAIRGNVKDGGVELSWAEIEKRATSHIKTPSPTHTADVKKVLDYRGIVIRDLLTELEAREDDGPGGHEITVVASDGYRAARPIGFFQRNPIMLAIEEDGLPLVRKTGGPLLEVMPHATHPETLEKAAEGGAYYVTALIVGTEKLALDVGGKKLDLHDLDGLSQKTVTGKVGFRSRWSTTGIAIHGPLLRDVIEVGAKLDLPSDGEVKIGRKPHADVASRATMLLPIADVQGCDIIVGTRFGDERALIPAVQGGPAILAFPKNCAATTKNQAWPTFVERIEVLAGDAGAPTGDGGANVMKDGGR